MGEGNVVDNRPRSGQRTKSEVDSVSGRHQSTSTPRTQPVHASRQPSLI